jgi:DNA-binding response OmpR family regulator
MNIIIASVGSVIENNLLSTLSQYYSDCSISVFTSKTQVIKKVREANSIDVVIIGEKLSDISGLDMVELLRDDSDMPIIYLSNDKDIKTLISAFDKGATDYIVTPFSEKVFMARLNAIIRRRIWDLKIRDYNVFSETA